MVHAGMVHALEEIHRLLKPDGCLIDIHPFIGEFIEVHQGRKITFAEAVPAFNDEDIRQAEDALARVVQRQLFLIERAAPFDFLIYASSVVELRAYFDEANAFDESSRDEMAAAWVLELAPRVEEAMRAAGEGAEVVYHEKAKISRMKPRR
jgi:SAM-dependent methyltransferase